MIFCNISSMYDANMDGCDISAASIRWPDVWALCGQGCPPPPPLVTSAAKASEAMCSRIPLQSLAEEADHILHLALKAMEAKDSSSGGGSSSSSCSSSGSGGGSSSTDAMIALARSQAAAASAEAQDLSSAASDDMERMLGAFPQEVLQAIVGLADAGSHGARMHHLPTLMGIRCAGKAGKPILRGVDLRGAYFTRCRLKCIDLSACDLTAACFIDCDLTEATLSSAIINGLVLDGSSLHSTDFDWIALLNKAREDVGTDERISLVGCSFRPFKLSPDSTISRVDLSRCRMPDAMLNNVKLQNVTLCGAKLARDLILHTHASQSTHSCAICIANHGDADARRV